MEESEINKELSRHLKDFNEFVNATATLRDSERQKYLIGLQMQESINLLKKVLPSLAQMKNVRTARQDNIYFLRVALINILDAGLTLGVLRKGASAILRSQLSAQISEIESKSESGKGSADLSKNQTKTPRKSLSNAGVDSPAEQIKAITDAEKSPVKKDKKRPKKVSKRG